MKPTLGKGGGFPPWFHKRFDKKNHHHITHHCRATFSCQAYGEWDQAARRLVDAKLILAAVQAGVGSHPGASTLAPWERMQPLAQGFAVWPGWRGRCHAAFLDPAGAVLASLCDTGVCWCAHECLRLLLGSFVCYMPMPAMASLAVAPASLQPNTHIPAPLLSTHRGAPAPTFGIDPGKPGSRRQCRHPSPGHCGTQDAWRSGGGRGRRQRRARQWRRRLGDGRSGGGGS